MTIPEPVRAGAEAALGARIAKSAPVGGGCVSPSVRIETGAGKAAFLKWGENAAMFDAEAASLAALADADAVHVPAVLGSSGGGADGGGPGWLLTEWLEPGAADAETWTRLGRGLARLHRGHAERYGWPEDNFIGSLPQRNDPADDWPEFWRERRLGPQLRRARGAGVLRGERGRFERLFGRLDELLSGPAAEDGASLLHGDLWSGNVHVSADGTAALIDPAGYRGHREVDLAMTELFGGFPDEFYRAYDDEWPLAPGYRPARRAVYQLYYLLVHVNMFGRGYVARTRSALDAALS